MTAPSAPPSGLLGYSNVKQRIHEVGGERATKHFKLGTVFFFFFYTWCMDGCLSQGWGHRRNSWELFWCNSLQFKVKGWTTFLNTVITVVSNAMPAEGSKVRSSWGFYFGHYILLIPGVFRRHCGFSLYTLSWYTNQTDPGSSLNVPSNVWSVWTVWSVSRVEKIFTVGTLQQQLFFKPACAMQI